MAEATALAVATPPNLFQTVNPATGEKGLVINDVLSTRRCRLRPMFTGRKLPGVERALGSALL